MSDRRRWVALAFIAVAQLMIALDATIVSIALPSAQAALGVTDANRQWVVTAYTLSFGGLLLLGGRIADLAGRKRAFLIGLTGFAIASIAGGAAPTFGVLIAARALQGAFAALLAPTALSLLAISFTEPRERATAFAVYGSIAGSGAAIGLLLGGVLTEYLSWRWCLYVNVPIAIIAAIGGAAVLPRARRRGRNSTCREWCWPQVAWWRSCTRPQQRSPVAGRLLPSRPCSAPPSQRSRCLSGARGGPRARSCPCESSPTATAAAPT